MIITTFYKIYMIAELGLKKIVHVPIYQVGIILGMVLVLSMSFKFKRLVYPLFHIETILQVIPILAGSKHFRILNSGIFS